MGEISRTIGIAGENITIENFCKMIGWRGTPNLEFLCKDRKKHEKRTHDIDYFSTYPCPLINDTQQCIYVSVKYTKIPSNIKTTFVEYITSISKSTECFKIDSKYQNLISDVKHTNFRHSQVIFWLNHSEAIDKDLAREIGNINSEIEQDIDNIYLVDNFRITFLYTVIRFAKQLYPNDKISFYYPATGVNEPELQGRDESGITLPVQFINSPIIPLRIIDKHNYKILYLAVRENFEEDSLKRVMGLAQSLTSGWCNKVILCFPDYQQLKHSFIKDSVFLKFSQSQFADMVEVKCYQDSFKSFEKNDDVEYVDAFEKNPEFNIENMLPFGDRLRQLLMQSKVQKSELQILLFRRGVYVNNKYGKEYLVPLLTTSLISPSEFEYIRRRHNAKETTEKLTSQNLIVDKDSSISEVIHKVSVSISEAVKKSNPNNEIISVSNFIQKDNGEIEAECYFRRPFLTKDWATINPTQKLKIVIKPPKKYDKHTSKVGIDIIATSNEAKIIGKDVVKDVIGGLKDKGLIRRDVFLQKTLASDFTNEQRTNFLFSFLSITSDESNVFTFFGVTDLDFAISKEVLKSIPDDIASLKDKVQQSVFSGRNLEEINYVKDPYYREFFVFEVLASEYIFQWNEMKGKVQIEFGFPDLKHKPSDKSEFEFKINDIHPYVEKNLSSKEYQELNEFLQDEFNRLKLKKFNSVERKYGQQLKFIE